MDEQMPQLPEPKVLKQPEGGELVDTSQDIDAPYFWAWMSHGYDTGMEPYYSADQMHACAKEYAAALPSAAEAPMQPTYYVQHPDNSYSVADPQPIQTPAVRTPLGDAQVKLCAWGFFPDCNNLPEFVEPLIRSVEAAHGIKATP